MPMQLSYGYAATICLCSCHMPMQLPYAYAAAICLCNCHMGCGNRVTQHSDKKPLKGYDKDSKRVHLWLQIKFINEKRDYVIMRND